MLNENEYAALTPQERVQYCIDAMERAGLLVWDGRMQRGQPAYVMSDWARELDRIDPALSDKIWLVCDEPEELKKLFAENKAILDRVRSNTLN
jgi:hypothetical protein